jgi:hypothetical protein
LCGYKFSYIAAQNKFRSTLKTVESLEWRASARPRARLLAARAKGACKDFSRVPSSLVLSVAQKVRKAKEQENNIRMNIKVKYSG